MGIDYSTSGLHGLQPTRLRGIVSDNIPPKKISAGLLTARIAVIEFITVAFSAYLASVIYNRIVLLRLPPSEQYISAAVFLAALVFLVSLGFRHFTVIQSQPRHQFLWNGIGAVALAFSFFLSTLFLMRWTDEYSRGTLLIQFIAVSFAVIAERATTHSWLQSAIVSGAVEAQRVILIGDTTNCSKAVDCLTQAGIHIVGSFQLPNFSITEDVVKANFTARKNAIVRKIIADCRVVHPDSILIFVPVNDLAKIIPFANALSVLPVSLHIAPVGVGNLLTSYRLEELGGLKTIQMLYPPLSFFDQVVKRIFDIMCAIIGLIILSPLLLMVSIAIRLDSRGPVLFRQTRHGYNNEIIRVFKFRSMNVVEDGDKFKQATKNDCRVTRVGHILRRSNLDELPQLLNVLLGEMSIVGPRPHPTALNKLFEQQIPPLSKRHNVKPGITGWAQVNGYRGETDALEKMQKRVEYDLYYIDNWSFLLDLEIILLTLFSKKAYTNAF